MTWNKLHGLLIMFFFQQNESSLTCPIYNSNVVHPLWYLYLWVVGKKASHKSDAIMIRCCYFVEDCANILRVLYANWLQTNCGTCHIIWLRFLNCIHLSLISTWTRLLSYHCDFLQETGVKWQILSLWCFVG